GAPPRMFPIVTGTRLWARNPVHVRWESPVTGCAAATKAASLFADERVALLRRVDETCGRERAGEVPRVDDRPVPQQPHRRDAATSPSHHDQVVAGEELGACDDDEDQPEREGDAPDQSDGDRTMATGQGASCTQCRLTPATWARRASAVAVSCRSCASARRPRPSSSLGRMPPAASSARCAASSERCQQATSASRSSGRYGGAARERRRDDFLSARDARRAETAVAAVTIAYPPWSRLACSSI